METPPYNRQRQQQLIVELLFVNNSELQFTIITKCLYRTNGAPTNSRICYRKS